MRLEKLVSLESGQQSQTIALGDVVRERIYQSGKKAFFFLSTFECLHFVFNQAARHQKVTNFETKGISTVGAFQNIASQNSKTL